MANNNQIKLLTIEKSLDLNKAANGTSLKKLSKNIDERNVVQTITYLILRLSEQFNVGKKFTPEQASILAFDIVEIYQYETIEDILLMLKYVRIGKIGDGKDFKLDAQTILKKWMPQYLELKSEQREKELQAKKGELNGMSSFKWDKEDIDKFKVGEGKSISKPIGQRLKEYIGTESNNTKPVMSREQYLVKMAATIKEQPLNKLKNYLVNNSKDSKNFDDVLYEMVEIEIDKRNKNENKKSNKAS